MRHTLLLLLAFGLAGCSSTGPSPKPAPILYTNSGAYNSPEDYFAQHAVTKSNAEMSFAMSSRREKSGLRNEMADRYEVDKRRRVKILIPLLNNEVGYAYGEVFCMEVTACSPNSSFETGGYSSCSYQGEKRKYAALMAEQEGEMKLISDVDNSYFYPYCEREGRDHF